MKNVEAGMQLK